MSTEISTVKHKTARASVQNLFNHEDEGAFMIRTNTGGENWTYLYDSMNKRQSKNDIISRL
jgi:hypothetical protein